MKPICISQIFYEDSEFVNHYRQKTSSICFFSFEPSKSWNCWPFYPTGTMSRIHTFEKRQCDRCQHRSAVKNTPPPSLSLPVPIAPHNRTHHPSANCKGPMISGLLDPVTSSANGVGSLAQSIGIRSVRAPPPLLPSAHKTGSSSGEKGLSLSEGLGKEIHEMAQNVSGKNRHSGWGETCSN
jgi:hypothetical protein